MAKARLILKDKCIKNETLYGMVLSDIYGYAAGYGCEVSEPAPGVFELTCPSCEVAGNIAQYVRAGGCVRKFQCKEEEKEEKAVARRTPPAGKIYAEIDISAIPIFGEAKAAYQIRRLEEYVESLGCEVRRSPGFMKVYLEIDCGEDQAALEEAARAVEELGGTVKRVRPAGMLPYA